MELKPLQQNIVNTPAADTKKSAAGVNNTDGDEKKISKKVGLTIFFVYLAGAIIFIIYSHISFKNFKADIRAKRAAAEKVDEERRVKDQDLQQERTIYVPEEAVYDANVQEQNRVPSTDLFLKAAQAEKGEDQQAQPQVLDYGAQVAAYEAQVKAKEQQAGVRQAAGTPQTYTAPVQQRPQQAGAVKSPTSLIQPEKQQETKLNKLETRRIFK